ncbi:hypothetical protein [Candidatus Similichlamydia epinepheli]|uniref:hypothetical protein n=1 Tax=Candidatus Similichlamydia epinepheli TaxID=1903953 RepID=UPI000D3854E9|nr:hypothetical protein [Candidatus Similichlamydia epinepheli]
MTLRRLIARLKRIFFSSKISESPPENLRDMLLRTNISEKIVLHVISAVQDQGKYVNWQEIIRNELMNLCQIESPQFLHKFPQVIFLLGENGHGKTTSCAKIANYFLQKGKKVSLISSDTFRAAAGEQLKFLANSIGVPCLNGDQKSDPASVVFRGIELGLRKNNDVIVVDTSGRLSNNQNLMMELKKSISVAKKFLPEERVIPLLVIDNSLGHYAVTQVRKFSQCLDLKGYFFTRTETPSGALFSVLRESPLPVAFLGAGQQISDISLFHPSNFIDMFMETLTRSH